MAGAVDPGPAPSEAHENLYDALVLAGRGDPGRNALVEGASGVSYAVLLRRVEEFAALIEGKGLGPGDRVAVHLPNSAAFVVAAFAVWRLGAVLVPLNPNLVEAEIGGYLRNTAARGLVATNAFAAAARALPGHAASLTHVWLWRDGEWVHAPIEERAPDAPRGARPVDPDGRQPAVVLFSTGSTGVPKQVTRSHRQVLGEVRTVARRMEVAGRDRVLGAVPFFHTYGLVNGLLVPCLSGASAYPVDAYFARDAARLIESEQVTGFPAVPFMLRLLVELSGRVELRSLRYVLSAGAPLSPEVAEGFQAKFGIPVRQHYGTTETGFVTVEPRSPEGGTPGLVGLPIDGVTVSIFDSYQRQLPANEEGSVGIASPFAAAGYDNPSPESDSTFEGSFFFPGDRGYLRSDGQLVLTGRTREFVNVAGQKVDPTEVEAVLRQHPAVEEVVVFGLGDEGAGQKLKAVIVPRAACTREEIYAFCATRLADFKKPRLIEFRDRLPRSPTGKILRKYLLSELDEAPGVPVFDPRTGFRPAPLGSLPDSQSSDLATLSPVLRSLLVTDGTISTILEALFWEPIRAEVVEEALEHIEGHGDADAPLPGLRPGDPLLKRRVVLRGEFTMTPYVFAESIVALSAMPERFRSALDSARSGVGELIARERLETYRQLLSVTRTRAGENWGRLLAAEPDGPVAMRRYVIHHDGKAAIHITEVFPEIRFRWPSI